MLVIFVILFVIFIFTSTPSKCNMRTILKTLSRQAARWSIAATQDRSPMIAVLHANYGAGYLWAMKDIATSEQIKDATGIDMQRFEREITRIQDAATRQMVRACPSFGVSGYKYLTKIAGEG